MNKLKGYAFSILGIAFLITRYDYVIIGRIIRNIVLPNIPESVVPVYTNCDMDYLISQITIVVAVKDTCTQAPTFLLKLSTMIPHNIHIVYVYPSFVGCDSVGQHFAYSLGTPSTVITGATFPENTTYPDKEGVNIVDLGQNDRQYDPIRITFDERISRVNENLMFMTPEIEDYVIDTIMGRQTDE